MAVGKLTKSRYIGKYMFVFYICLIYVLILLLIEIYSVDNHVSIVNKVYKIKHTITNIYSSDVKRDKVGRVGSMKLSRTLERHNKPIEIVANQNVQWKDGHQSLEFVNKLEITNKKAPVTSSAVAPPGKRNISARKNNNLNILHKKTHRPHAVQKIEEINNCPVEFALSNKSDSENFEEILACIPHRASQQDCKYAKEVYKLDAGLQKCKHATRNELCSFATREIRAQERPLKVNCDGRETGHCKAFALCGINNATGDTIELKRVHNITILEKSVEEIAEKTIRNKFSFLFIKCLGENDKVLGNQLLILPTTVMLNKRKLFEDKTKKLKPPNVNVILLDSISRAHFYRSLPVVIEKFNEINTKSNHHHNQNAEVLDFQLFQSVHGHSAENFHALFTGTLFPDGLKDAEKERMAIGAQELFGIFKNAGYETMYQDDLCWRNWWGTRMELGSPSNWTSFLETVKRANIDTTGISSSSCEILKANKLPTPFNGPSSNQICFNGKFQHSYLFQFLHQFYKETSLHNTRPRFSFTAINTAHDYAGLRVQTLNNDLAEFVHEMSLLQNTLTILMADHGNTYTKYTNAVMEGRYEMFHPSFFMIIPHGVAKYFGHETMQSLRLNSNRLFTMLDVHASLKSIAEKATNKQMKGSKGILEVIPANRTCNDLDLRLPNLCVCEGWDTEVRNDTRQVAALEFAVGTLNNLILKQQEGQGEFTTKCNRLYPLYFSNVRERSAGEHLITTMDFRVKAGRGADQTEDIFHVEIQSTIKPDHDSMAMKLLSFDRLSQYGIYRKCQDKKVDTRLCICSLNDEQNQSIEPRKSQTSKAIKVSEILRLQNKHPEIPVDVKEEIPTNVECVRILKRTYYKYIAKKKKVDRTDTSAAVWEVVNSCRNRKFNIRINIETTNAKVSHSVPVINEEISGNRIKFLFVASKYIPYWKSRVKTKYSVKEIFVNR
eukprot:gene19097-21013_t